MSDDKKKRTLKDLNGDEVVIDGKIYNISNFAHPGGEAILVFGGNDVSTQYRMIHPNHSSKQVEKMQYVGELADFETDYIWDTPFERELKEKVFAIVKRGQEFGTSGYFMRAIFYICLMAWLQLTWIFSGSSALLAIALGIAQALIGLNVQHDANHGAASKKSWVNELLGFGADFIGGSKVLWMQQHWTHHTYTNQHGKDPDAISAEPLLLFHDYPLGHIARRAYHSFQSIFFLPLLSFYWASSVFNPQIFDLQHAGAKTAGIRMDNDWTIAKRKISWLIRAFYILANCIVPIFHHGFTLTAFFHIWLLGCTESLMLSVLFSLSHNFENAERYPTQDANQKDVKTCWFKSQVETSSTYGGKIAGYITGGLNFQIEHHLFPRMCSAWYPYIQPVVREVCAKHKVRYTYYPTIWSNLLSTFKYIHSAGTGASWERNPLAGN